VFTELQLSAVQFSSCCQQTVAPRRRQLWVIAARAPSTSNSLLSTSVWSCTEHDGKLSSNISRILRIAAIKISLFFILLKKMISVPGRRYLPWTGFGEVVGK